MFSGIKTIITHEYRYRMWVYHGAVAELAGILMLLGAFLLFRGRVWRKRDWVNWTVLDKFVGAVALTWLFVFYCDEVRFDFVIITMLPIKITAHNAGWRLLVPLRGQRTLVRRVRVLVFGKEASESRIAN